jgi:hypothetical protein
MNTVRKHSCLLVNWNGRPFPLTSSRRWCCISLFQAVALVVVTVLNYFWPLDFGVLHALLFLFAVVRSTFRRFEIIRVATQGETASFLLYRDYVSLPIHINDLERFQEEESVKLSLFIVVSDQDIVADYEMRFLPVLGAIYFTFVFHFLLLVCFS